MYFNPSLDSVLAGERAAQTARKAYDRRQRENRRRQSHGSRLAALFSLLVHR